ncbi:protein of unknown function [Paraburkholderia dioscoreae]|uniref:Uncharacterized protein n=1 Tax=Paraburkholderia dioscoreae TaxID=2604047 RepID=A0A5Q4ZD71_9BURK|nr:protein of unknown function [Paraburkholderia dioscoreae]
MYQAALRYVGVYGQLIDRKEYARYSFLN